VRSTTAVSKAERLPVDRLDAALRQIACPANVSRLSGPRQRAGAA
jgi:hypothetical protein